MTPWEIQDQKQSKDWEWAQAIRWGHEKAALARGELWPPEETMLELLEDIEENNGRELTKEAMRPVRKWKKRHPGQKLTTAILRQVLDSGFTNGRPYG
jgi:hypothetical protein